MAARTKKPKMIVQPLSESGRVFKIEEAAVLINICSKTIRHLALLGDIPHIKIGREYRFTERQLEDFLKSKVKAS